MENEIIALKSHIKDSETNLSHLKHQREKYITLRTKINQTITELTTHIDNAEIRIETIKDELNQLESEI